MTVSLVDLKKRVRKALSEEDTEFFTDDAVREWINEAQDDLSSKVPVTVTVRIAMATVPDADIYVIDDSILQPSHTWIELSSGVIRKLKYSSPDIMERLKWVTTVPRGGTPYRVTYRRTTHGLVVELDRAPQNNERLIMEGNRRPRVLISDTEECEVPDSMTQAIVKYAVWQAKVKDEEDGQADRARGAYLEAVEDVRARRYDIQNNEFEIPRARYGSRRTFGWFG